MLTTFERALKYTLENEGGDKYTEHPADPGGATKFGITQKTLDAYAKYKGFYYLDVKNLTEHEAATFYREVHWDVLHCDKLPSQLALVLFDFSVLIGVPRAAKFLQESVDAVGAVRVTFDGIVGPKTVAATKAANEKHVLLCFLTKVFLHLLVISPRDSRLHVFRNGWFNRVVRAHRVAFE